MSKDQERKALEKIAAIIEEAGPDSYLNMTFAGILEQAEENITNDFASNYKEMYESARDVIDKMNQDAQKLKNEIERITSEKEDTERLYQTTHDMSMKYIEDLNNTIAKYDTAKKENEALKQEIITLKAKLYDLMTV